MKIFTCQQCSQIVYFENTTCERCASVLGYLPDQNTLSAVVPKGRNWVALASPDRLYRFCSNWERRACNWMVPADAGTEYCAACRHNDAIPDVTDPIRHQQWQKIEEAKRRLFYSLIKLKLPLRAAADGAAEPLVFDFLADLPNSAKVMTGHDNGRITIALVEADDAQREKNRAQMGEDYRTLLGHFRHEVGHYYWDVLVRDGDKLEAFRKVFGDERVDYSEALKRHYRDGAPTDWREHFVSSYASVHPWEDFAESWAHYIHIVDTLEMAYAFGLSVSPSTGDGDALTASVDRNPYRLIGIDALIAAWLPITTAVNNLNRAMGQPDLYPFVLSPLAIEKIGYIEQIIHANFNVVQEGSSARKHVGNADATA